MKFIFQGTHLSQGAAAAQAVLPTGAIAFATAPGAGGSGATATVRMVAPHPGQYAIMQSAGGHPGMQQGIMLLSAGGQQIPGVGTLLAMWRVTLLFAIANSFYRVA